MGLASSNKRMSSQPEKAQFKRFWLSLARACMEGVALDGTIRYLAPDETTITLERTGPMTGAEIDRVQTYLRRLLGSDKLTIVPPLKPGFPIEVAVEGETIGTVDKDTDEGEISYAVTLTILDEDLPPLPKAAAKPAAKAPAHASSAPPAPTDPGEPQ